jgi:hypothetical protein
MVGLGLIKLYIVGPCTYLSNHLKFHDWCNRSGMLHNSLIRIHMLHSWSSFLLNYSFNFAKPLFYCISSKVKMICRCKITKIAQCKIETISSIGSQNIVHYINYLNISSSELTYILQRFSD